MTLRDAAVREESSPFHTLSLVEGDYAFVMYVVPYATGSRMQSEQLLSGLRKDAWHPGDAWEAIPLSDLANEPLLSLGEKLQERAGHARLPSNDDEHNAALVLNNLI